MHSTENEPVPVNRIIDNTPSATRLSLLAAGAVLPIAMLQKVGAVEQFETARFAMLMAIAAVWFCAGASRYGIRALMPRAALWLPAAVFLALLAFSGNFFDSATRLQYYTALFAIFALSSVAFAREDAAEVAATGIMMGAVFSSIIGIMDIAGATGVPKVVNWGDRTAGLFEDPNWFGLHIALCLFWCLAPGRGESVQTRRLRWAAIPLCAVALLLSNSRSAWTATALALPVFVIAAIPSALKKEGAGALKYAASFIAVILIAAAVLSHTGLGRNRKFVPVARAKTIFFMPGKGPSGRENLIAASKKLISQKPMTGWGADSFPARVQCAQADLARDGKLLKPAITRTRHAYNDYLEIAAESGVPALVVYMALLTVVFICALATAFGGGALSPLAPAFAACVVCYGLFGAFYQSAMHNIPSTALFWITAGAAAASSRRDKEQPPAADHGISFAAAVFVAIWLAYFGAYVPVRFEMKKSESEAFYGKKKYKLAEKAATAAIALNPEDAGARISLANAATRLRKYDVEEKQLVKAASLLPCDPDMNRRAGDFFMENGKADAAARFFYEALRCATADRENDFLLYSEALLEGGHFNESLETLKSGAYEYPRSTKIRAQASRVYFEMKNLPDAEMSARSGLDIDINCSICHIRLSQALYAAGQFQLAYNHAVFALSIEPRNSYARNLAASLERELKK